MIETETGIPTFCCANEWYARLCVRRRYCAGRNRKTVYGKNTEFEFAGKGKQIGRSVNLLGVTPLDFGPQKNVELLKENLHKYGWNVFPPGRWAMHWNPCKWQKQRMSTW